MSECPRCESPFHGLPCPREPRTYAQGGYIEAEPVVPLVISPACGYVPRRVVEKYGRALLEKLSGGEVISVEPEDDET